MCVCQKWDNAVHAQHLPRRPESLSRVPACCSACTAKLVQKSIQGESHVTASVTNPLGRIGSTGHACVPKKALPRCCRRVEAVASRIAPLNVKGMEENERGPCCCHYLPQGALLSSNRYILDKDMGWSACTTSGHVSLSQME